MAAGGTERADEALVRAVEAAYDRAWVAGDLDGLVGCLADEAVVVDPRGQVAHGTEEIRAMLGEVLRGPARASVHETKIDRVSFATRDVAIVDGEASILRPDGSPYLRHRFVDVLVRQEGAWRIAHIRAWVPEPGTRGR